MSLLACIVHTRGEAGQDQAAQFEERVDRQPREGANLGMGSLGTRHPGWHRERRAVGPVHDVVRHVVTVVPPDHR